MSKEKVKKDDAKERPRFLKKVMIYNLIMATIVTLAALYISYLARDISGSVVTPLCALWSIELSLSAWIKITEGKEIKIEKQIEEISPFEDHSI